MSPDNNIQENSQENTLFNFINESFTFQVLSIALPSFYRKTELSGQISYVYIPNQDSVLINVGFSPRAPNEAEYLIFLEDLKIAEKFIVGNTFLSYTEDLTDMDELKELNEKILKETKTASIYLDINLSVDK